MKFPPYYSLYCTYYGLVFLRAGLLVQSISVNTPVNGTTTAAPSLIFSLGDIKNITDISCEKEPDGFCDAEYNIPQCEFDASDCIRGKSLPDLYPNCSQELILRHGDDDDISWNVETEKIGNGLCDTSHFNIEACGFEFGECVEFNDEYSLCDYAYNESLKFGNGVCDREFNNRECKYDGGDCKQHVALSFKIYIMLGVVVIGCTCIHGAAFLQNRRQGLQLSEYEERPARLRQNRLRTTTYTSHPIDYMHVLDEDRRNDILDRIIQKKVCGRSKSKRSKMTKSRKVVLPIEQTDEESGGGGGEMKMTKEEVTFKDDVYIRGDQDSHCSASKSSSGKSSKVTHVRDSISANDSMSETPYNVGSCEDSNSSCSKLSLERSHCVRIERAEDSLSGLGSKSSSEMSQYYSPKTCSICMERYRIGDDIAWSSNEDCPHAFHVECIVRWLMTHSHCPMCRSPYLGDPGSICATR